MTSSDRASDAWVAGWTVGPGVCSPPGCGGAGGALVVACAGCDVGGSRFGYCRAAAPAVRDAFDADDPIVDYRTTIATASNDGLKKF